MSYFLVEISWKQKKESAFPLEPCESLYVCASEHGCVVVGVCLDVSDSEHGVT